MSELHEQRKTEKENFYSFEKRKLEEFKAGDLITQVLPCPIYREVVNDNLGTTDKEKAGELFTHRSVCLELRGFANNAFYVKVQESDEEFQKGEPLVLLDEIWNKEPVWDFWVDPDIFLKDKQKKQKKK